MPLDSEYIANAQKVRVQLLTSDVMRRIFGDNSCSSHALVLQQWDLNYAVVACRQG